jgi:hypothetical protein
MKRSLYAAAFAALFFTACSKDEATVNSDTRAPLTIEFDNIVGGQNLQLNTGTYTNASGEDFKVTTLKYYVSNIKLTKTDGSVYTVPQDSSYFLIQEGGNDEAAINLPEGDYKTLTFTLGVDSLRSTKDLSQRTGALDPTTSDMYWSWNSGYIFFKMEGTSSFAPASGQNKYYYHIGGFGGYSSVTINNIKTITLDLTTGGIAKVRSGRTPNLHLMADISKMFTGTTNVSIAANSMVMFSNYSVNIANNYASMFRHDHTEN